MEQFVLYKVTSNDILLVISLYNDIELCHEYIKNERNKKKSKYQKMNNIMFSGKQNTKEFHDIKYHEMNNITLIYTRMDGDKNNKKLSHLVHDNNDILGCNHCDYVIEKLIENKNY